MHWLSMPARYLARDNDPTAPAVWIRFGAPVDGFDLTASAGRVTVTPCRPDHTPDVTVDGEGPVLVGLLQGSITLAQAKEPGSRSRETSAHSAASFRDPHRQDQINGHFR